MSLKNKLNETKLRSLKYGDNEPYVVINIDDQSFDKGNNSLIDKALNLLPDNFNILGNDINLRNTRIGASVIDTVRIGRYLTDPKNGPKFIATQIGLQAMNVNSNFGEGPISNQIYNPFITLSQISLSGIGGHLKRQGIIPGQISDFFGDLDTYEKIKEREKLELPENSALEKLRQKFIQLPNEDNNSNEVGFLNILKNKSKFISNVLKFINTDRNLYSYLGGPESFLGIGITNIKRYYNSSEDILKNEGKNLRGFTPYFIERKINLGEFGPNGTKVIYPILYGATLKGEELYPEEFNKIIEADNDVNNTEPLYLKQTGSAIPSTLFTSFKQAKQYVNNPDNPYKYGSNNSQLSTANSKIEYSNYKGQKITIGGSWFQNSREERIGFGETDLINLTPIFSEEKGQTDTITINGKDNNIRDLVKFRIETILNNNKSNWLVFRAYITNISDQVSSQWTDINYINRSEKLYIYNSFDRTINVDFKVAALSKNEMKFIYQKLNYLMSGMAGYYNEGLLEGTFSRLTIGNYIDRQHGIINSLTYKINMNETPWEIAMREPEGEEKVLILPHIIDVSLSFKPIGINNQGKNMLPQRADNNNLSFIAQNDNGDVNYITGSIPVGTFK